MFSFDLQNKTFFCDRLKNIVHYTCLKYHCCSSFQYKTIYGIQFDANCILKLYALHIFYIKKSVQWKKYYIYKTTITDIHISGMYNYD